MVRVVVATSACAVAAAVVVSASSAGRVATYSTPTTIPLRTAVLDPNLFLGPQAAQAFTVTRAAGATFVRLSAVWGQLAPGTPAPGFDASDPDSIGYNWTPLDVQVVDAERAGLQPILDIGKPPGWALVTPPTGLDGGTPQLAALGAFAHALAAHYNGNDGVPAVHVFQVWNEPNLSRDLSPVDPAAYRAMVNAVAAAVHQVDRRNLVVAGALDPFENHTSQWHTMAPLAFMRQMLCVSAGPHPHATCADQAHFDVWSHHPYTFGGPFGKARLPDDVSLGDLPKMASLLRTATKLHRIASTDHVQFWVTEFAIDTAPRTHHTLSLSLQARAVAESFHQMWLSGVSLVTWFLLQDEPLTTPYQCGFYYYGQPIASALAKPSLTVFRFPFVAYLDGSSVSVWGRDGTSSSVPVTIQLRSGAQGAWSTVARIRANGSGIFEATLPLSATKSDWLRAVAPPGSGASLPFSLTRPHYPHWGPWGR